MSTELLVQFLIVVASLQNTQQNIIQESVLEEKTPFHTVVPAVSVEKIPAQVQPKVNIDEVKPKSTLEISKSSVRDIGKKVVEKTTPQLLAELPPIMRKIAYCESGSKHYDPKTGGILRGRITPGDVGIFQINTKVHLSTAKQLGLDVFTKTGNVAYAMHLYKVNGTRDWNASKGCWT